MGILLFILYISIQVGQKYVKDKRVYCESAATCCLSFKKSYVSLSILGVKGHGLVRTKNAAAAMSFCDITKSHTIIINRTSLMLASLRRL